MFNVGPECLGLVPARAKSVVLQEVSPLVAICQHLDDMLTQDRRGPNCFRHLTKKSRRLDPSDKCAEVVGLQDGAGLGLVGARDHDRLDEVGIRYPIGHVPMEWDRRSCGLEFVDPTLIVASHPRHPPSIVIPACSEVEPQARWCEAIGERVGGHRGPPAHFEVVVGIPRHDVSTMISELDDAILALGDAFITRGTIELALCSASPALGFLPVLERVVVAVQGTTPYI